jgi:hypothetical protein
VDDGRRSRWTRALPIAIAALGCAEAGRESDRPVRRRTAGPVETSAPDPTPAPATAAGWTEIGRLEAPSHDVGGEPHVVVHAPPGLPAVPPWDVVVFLHGWDCCAVSMVGDRACGARDPVRGGWGVGRHHDAAGVPALLVVPQLAHLERSSDVGRFGEPGFFRRFLDEVLGEAVAARLGGPRSTRDLATVSLVAHSAGGQTLRAILRAGDLAASVRHVVFLDALYGGADEVAGWAAARPGRRVVSVHTALGATTRQSDALFARLAAALGADRVSRDPADLQGAVRANDAVVYRTRRVHGDVPAAHLADILAGLSGR